MIRKNIFLAFLITVLMAFVVFISYMKVNNKKQTVTKVKTEFKKDYTYLDTFPTFEEQDNWIDSGKVIYKMNCATCHSFIRESYGPMLTDKPGFGRMYEIIRSINDLEKIGDKYTIDLLKKWNNRARMPEYKDVLTDDQIKMLISYLKYEIAWSKRRCVH
jgi:mono/diheme cytochrome c family protein